MLQVTFAGETPPVKRRIQGICEDAKALGVTRRHLWGVLTGERVSRRLTAQYKRLVRAKKKAESKK